MRECHSGDIFVSAFYRQNEESFLEGIIKGLENDDLNNYKAKAEYYIRQHQDNVVIAKLKTNRPLSSTDIKILEDIIRRFLQIQEST